MKNVFNKVWNLVAVLTLTVMLIHLYIHGQQYYFDLRMLVESL